MSETESTGTSDDDEIIGRIRYDERLAPYAPFMDDPLGPELGDAARGTLYVRSTQDLLRAWRVIDYSRSLPFAFVRSLPNVVTGAVGATYSGTPEAIVRGLLLRVRGFTVSPRGQEAIRAAANELFLELQRNRARLADDMRAQFQSAEMMWDYMLGARPFIFAIANGERQSYAGLYFAYEHFLGRAVQVNTNKWPGATRLLKERFKECFPDLFEVCLDDAAIRAAEYARDAFAHRGGRVKDETQKDKEEAESHSKHLRIEDGEIQILAEDTRALFSLLYSRVMQFLKAAPRVQSRPSTPPS